MLNWLKKSGSNAKACAKLERRRVAKSDMDFLNRKMRNDEKLLLQELRQKAAPLLQQKIIRQICQEAIDSIIDTLEKLDKY